MESIVKGFSTTEGRAYYDYNFLANKPNIPVNISELINDENFVNGAYIEDNYLYLTYGGQVVQEPLGPFGSGDAASKEQIKEVVEEYMKENPITNENTGLSVSDDGKGNVIIEVVGFSVTDDDFGNITIA